MSGYRRACGIAHRFVSELHRPTHMCTRCIDATGNPCRGIIETLHGLPERTESERYGVEALIFRAASLKFCIPQNRSMTSVRESDASKCIERIERSAGDLRSRRCNTHCERDEDLRLAIERRRWESKSRDTASIAGGRHDSNERAGELPHCTRQRTVRALS